MSTATPSSSESPGEIPVLISGAGPTGLLTAILLTKMNIPCQILERERCFSPPSKALWVHSRTQEILHLIDPELMDQILEQGERLPLQRYYVGGRKVLEARMLPRNESVFESLVQLPQAKLVRILERALEKASGGKIGVEWGWEVVETRVVHAPGDHAPREETLEKKEYDDKDEGDGDISSPDWVETTVRRALKGTDQRTGKSKILGAITLPEEDEGKQYEHKVIRSRYLVGADGARSAVRHKMNIPFVGRTRESNMIVFDGTVDSNILIDGACINWFDGRGIAVLPMGERNRVQIIINTFESLTADQFKALQSETLTLENFQPILDAHVHPARMKILSVKWLSYYRAHERNATEYIVQDRIIFAGDAAHSQSFAAGQGMNLGLQDAYNLCWKLAMVLSGIAPPSLLDSYNEERPAIADDVIKFSSWALDNELCLDTKFKRALKRVVVKFHPITKHLFAHKLAPMSMISLRYHKNSLNKEHQTQRVSSRSGSGAIGQRAGDGFLIPFGNNIFGSESSEFSSYQDIGSNNSNDINRSVAPATKDQNTIRFHDLAAGHPGAFQILVFTSDLWKRQASTATALSQTIEHYLAHWRSQWRSPAPSPSSSPSNGLMVDEVVKQMSRPHLFMIHTFTTLSGSTLALGKITLGNKMVGEGMAYTDVDGVLHRRYEADSKAWCMAAKLSPDRKGAIIVVRPDSYIAFRVRGIGESAWGEVDGYFQSILSSRRHSLETLR